ncbi:hypothetical protein [Cryptosporangium sp. NPDC048952]|uniref:hypothetical protein n=1 Tax=Cryptosporangium sp. NPDC048952 TaxID=3363961 RepID=UPI003716B209
MTAVATLTAVGALAFTGVSIRQQTTATQDQISANHDQEITNNQQRTLLEQRYISRIAQYHPDNTIDRVENRSTAYMDLFVMGGFVSAVSHEKQRHNSSASDSPSLIGRTANPDESSDQTPIEIWGISSQFYPLPPCTAIEFLSSNARVPLVYIVRDPFNVSWVRFRNGRFSKLVPTSSDVMAGSTETSKATRTIPLSDCGESL